MIWDPHSKSICTLYTQGHCGDALFAPPKRDRSTEGTHEESQLGTTSFPVRKDQHPMEQFHESCAISRMLPSPVYGTIFHVAFLPDVHGPCIHRPKILASSKSQGGTGGSGPYLAAKSSLATCTFRRFSAVLLPAQKLLSLVSR